MPTSTNNVIIGPDETATKVSQAGHIFNAEAFDNFVQAVDTPITSASGGFQFPNWPCAQLWIRNASGNAPMFLGGIGQNAVFSGRGMRLYGNEAITVPIKNANRMTIMASTSGQFIEYGVYLTADTSQITVDLSGIFRPPSDTTPPTLLSVTPVSGISGVEHNALISATFDEPIASASVNTGTFTVRLSGVATLVSGNVFLNPTNNMNAIFSPYSGQISGSLIYVARLAGGSSVSGITDVAGNAMAASAAWHWTTLSTAPPVDTTLPNISGTTPVSGEIDVPVDNSVFVTFSKQMNGNTVNSNNMFVSLSGSTVPADVDLMPDGITVKIDPNDDLDVVKKYTLNVLSGVKDIVGNSFSGSRLIPFTTAEPNWNTPYVVALESFDHHLDNNRFAIGERMTSNSPYPLSGKQFQKVRVYMAKEGPVISGVSGAQVVMRNAAGQLLGIFGRFNPASLTTTKAAYEFVNTDLNISGGFQHNYKIEVDWLSGNSSAKIAVAVTDSSEFTGGTTVTFDGATFSGASYSDQGGDLCGIFYSRN